MNILSHFNELLAKNFHDYLEIYFSNNNYLCKTSNFNNYYNFINNLDTFSTNFIKDIFKSYIEYIDNCFFFSSYRKNYCISKGFYERKNFVTLFGDISFKRRYYFDKNTNEHFFFADLFLGLPKRKHFDPFVCSEIIEQSAVTSYSKAGNIIANKIGNRVSSTISISRATARNIVMSFHPILNEKEELKRVERLFVMLDELFVGAQQNNGKDHMIKAAVIFENTSLEYKSKKKENSMNRYRLVGSHTCASSNNNLKSSVFNYISNHYDTDYLKEICFMGDCASWIKNFPNYGYFKFNDTLNISFSMDGFHFSQALKHITTNQNPHWYQALLHTAKKNNKDLFRILCEKFILENKHRESTIRSKMEYILNNWNERQLYQNKPYLKCSMESHISHILADLFTSRPKAYSKLGIEKLLQLRLLKCNGYDLKKLYFYSISHNNSSCSSHSFSEDFQSLHLNFHSYNIYDIEYPLSTSIEKKLAFRQY